MKQSAVDIIKKTKDKNLIEFSRHNSSDDVILYVKKNKLKKLFPHTILKTLGQGFICTWVVAFPEDILVLCNEIKTEFFAYTFVSANIFNPNISKIKNRLEHLIASNYARSWASKFYHKDRVGRERMRARVNSKKHASEWMAWLVHFEHRESYMSDQNYFSEKGYI